MKNYILYVYLISSAASTATPYLRTSNPSNLSGHKRTRDEMENMSVSESSSGSWKEWSDEDLAVFMERIDTSSTDTDVGGESEDISGLLGSWGQFHDDLDDLVVLECLSGNEDDEMILEDSEHSQTRRRCEAFDDIGYTE